MAVDLISLQSTIDAVRDQLGSDTATLLLLDESGTVLEPAASAGLGRRWRGATHVRVGTGFAGRVAATLKPVVLNEVTEVSVLNPILREAGVRRLLGVPVCGTRGLLGVLHVGLFEARDFGAEDTALLEKAAADLGARLSESTQDDGHLAALALQRSLLPAAPPDIDGLDVAVRYLPAEGDLGGDWYDIFRLPSGNVGIVLGDVAGHGLHAAVAMGRLRSALRAYALDHDDPAEVLHRLDRKLCHFESDVFATAVFAVAKPPFDELTLCLAGHPAPLYVGPSASAGFDATATNLLLGVDPRRERSTVTVPLAPGTALAFFTDGLVERKPTGSVSDPTSARLDQVQRVMDPLQNAETIASRIIAAGLGDESADDDVALVVLRRPPEVSRG